jgi:hypothetical protein
MTGLRELLMMSVTCPHGNSKSYQDNFETQQQARIRAVRAHHLDNRCKCLQGILEQLELEARNGKVN